MRACVQHSSVGNIELHPERKIEKNIDLIPIQQLLSESHVQYTLKVKKQCIQFVELRSKLLNWY